MIPFNDLARTNRKIQQELKDAVNRVIDNNWFILGQEDSRFEEAYAAHMEARHCIAVSNGLDALHLCLAALDLPKGSGVIVPANTFVATALAVSYCGYKLQLVDVDPDSLLMDPVKLEKAITPETRAVMPVHLYGNACDMDEICRIAREHDLFVIEDNAQAQGCRYKGKLTGNFGVSSGTSFYPGKNIGALGDAGAVMTDDDAMAARIRALANYGSSRRYHHELQGFNTRMDEMQAAVLQVKLNYLDEWNADRAKTAEYFLENIHNPLVRLPVIPFGTVWHLFTVRVPAARREEFMAYLEEKGVQTAIHYPIPVHQQKAYEKDFVGQSFPVSEQAAGELVTLPMFPGMTAEERDIIVDAVNSWK